MRDSGHLASMARRAERVEALYMLLCDIAASGSVCPDNAGLGLRMSPQCKGITVIGYMTELRESGRIRQVKHKFYRVVTIAATGAKTGDPKAGARRARQERKATPDFRIKARAATEASRGIPDLTLYGDRADDVTLLRRRGHYVVRSETVGEGAGRFVIDNRVVTVEELSAKAAHIRARVVA